MSGDYNFSIIESGTVKLYVDGRLVTQRLRDDFGYVDHVTVPLRAGHPASIVLDYSSEEGVAGHPVDPEHLQLQHVPGQRGPPRGGAARDDGPVAHPAGGAATAARSDVAVVFAGREVGEGHDIESLSLPGDQNALIEAVARANRHTVVVLTGGPVAMPWLHDVSGVLEMWEPGATFGTAAAVAAVRRRQPVGPAADHVPGLRQPGPGHDGRRVPRHHRPHDRRLRRLRPARAGELRRGHRRRLPLLPDPRRAAAVPVRLRPLLHDVRPADRPGVDRPRRRRDRRRGRHQPRLRPRRRRRRGLRPRPVVHRRAARAAAGVQQGVPVAPPDPDRPAGAAPQRVRVLELRARPPAPSPARRRPSTPSATRSAQPGGQWTVAPGVYGISVGGSSSQLTDSTHVFLSGHTTPGQLDGLFGWSLS